MPASYKILTDPNDTPQSVDDLSFKGGLPNMPDRLDVPHCRQCDDPLTFIFQIAFPEKHVWQERVMAMFICTSLNHPCGVTAEPADVFYYIEMEGHTHFDDEALDRHQKSFYFHIFRADETTQLQSKFDEKLVFERLAFERVNPRARYDGMDKVGGKPAWYNYWSTEEGASKYKKMTYEGDGFDFLMQIEDTWRLKRLPHAPLQYRGNYLSKVTAPARQNYSFFSGIGIKFLGTKSSKVDPPRVLKLLG